MQAAREQLWHLRGKTHHLISAVALVQKGQVIWHHQETARMTMRAFDPSDLDGVLEAEGPCALESEGPSVRLFEKIVGDYFAILGLPLLPLLAALRLHAPNLMNDNKPIKI
jgi:septum formation protein